MTQICSHLSIGPEDHFVELGCGTGRISLLLANEYPFVVTGIDLIEPFVIQAQQIAKQHSLPCTFLHADILEIDWNQFSILYVTATTYSEEKLQSLWQKSKEIRTGAMFITVTHPPPKQDFQLIFMEVCQFSWGVATVYISRRC